MALSFSLSVELLLWLTIGDRADFYPFTSFNSRWYYTGDQEQEVKSTIYVARVGMELSVVKTFVAALQEVSGT